MKGSIKVNDYINPNIKTGDIVEIIDGSSLSLEGSNDDYYIVYNYPELGIFKKLKECKFKVIATGVTDQINLSACEGQAYLQDIIILEIKSNNLFRTSSKHVRISEI